MVLIYFYKGMTDCGEIEVLLYVFSEVVVVSLAKWLFDFCDVLLGLYFESFNTIKDISLEFADWVVYLVEFIEHLVDFIFLLLGMPGIAFQNC